MIQKLWRDSLFASCVPKRPTPDMGCPGGAWGPLPTAPAALVQRATVRSVPKFRIPASNNEVAAARILSQLVAVSEDFVILS